MTRANWETSLQSNAVFHWLGANLESALVTEEKWLVNNSYECKIICDKNVGRYHLRIEIHVLLYLLLLLSKWLAYSSLTSMIFS